MFSMCNYSLLFSKYHNIVCSKFISNSSCRVGPVAQCAINDEMTVEIAKYPVIKNLSFHSRKIDAASEWHRAIQELPTVEEKMIKLNMARYYGHTMIELNGEKLPYNCLPAIQHYTRTLFLNENNEENLETDSITDKTQNKSKSISQLIRTDVQNALELALDYMRIKYSDCGQLSDTEHECLLSQVIVEQINRILINALKADYEHLNEMEIDYNPRHEAFWAVGGIDPPKNVIESKKGNKWQEEMIMDSIDRLMQYKSSPILALNHPLQLSPWKSIKELENLDLAKSLPLFKFDPRTLGFNKTRRHGTNIAGYWPGRKTCFGYLSYQSRAGLNKYLSMYTENDVQEALHAHAIQSTYSWLLAQACYFGFTTYNELTYPMNSQTIITNGRLWSFYEYQLNTLLIHGNNVYNNPRVNICRGTKPMVLYDSINANGKLVGFNDGVLEKLVEFYINVPNVQRSAKELQPYLDSKLKHVADYANEEKRVFLENMYKHISSNRPRHLEIPEIYLWEKIYKIDHKTRPLDARRRYFELGINPWRRRLDEHDKDYIPKVARPEGPKSKNKFKATYYP